MKIKFNILEVQPENRGAVVHFFTDAFDGGPRSTLFVTIYPDPMPTGVDLEDYIMNCAPTAWLLLKSQPPADMTALQALAAAPPVERETDSKGNIIPEGPVALARRAADTVGAIPQGSF